MISLLRLNPIPNPKIISFYFLLYNLNSKSLTIILKIIIEKLNI